MKYTNHLNVIVAIIGVIVIAQTLTRTFWNSTPEKKYSVDVPASQPKIKVQASRAPAAVQKRSASPSVLPGPMGVPQSSTVPPAAGAPSFATRGRLLTAPLVETNPNPGIAGMAPRAPATASPNIVTIPSAPTTAPPTGGLEGETRGRSIRGQVPFGARSTYRPQGGAESRTTTLPPPGGNDAGKRRPDPNAPTPPVRSSMPEQRVQ